MRKILLLILTLILVSCNSNIKEETKEINVLFVGNSLTYYNDMPQKLQDMLDEKDLKIRIDQITYPGFSLSRHLGNIVVFTSENKVNTRKKEEGEITETKKKLKEKKWDIIILQTGGIAVLIPESVKYQVDPAIKKIKTIVNNQDTRFILFNTWTTKEKYPTKYCYTGMMLDQNLDPNKDFCSPEIENSAHYLKLLNTSFENIAKENSLERTNHGDIFQKVFDNYPELKILEDDMHPSDNGAFLSASIFYEMITNKSAGELNYTGNLNNSDAETLKRLVE